MYATFWFLSNKQVVHNREAYNIIMLFAVFGGLAKVIMTTFQVIGEELNKQVIMAKFIRSLYFIEKPSEE